jgi:hypothetical protein
MGCSSRGRSVCAVGPRAGLLASAFIMACSWTGLGRRKPTHSRGVGNFRRHTLLKSQRTATPENKRKKAPPCLVGAPDPARHLCSGRPWVRSPPLAPHPPATARITPMQRRAAAFWCPTGHLAPASGPCVGGHPPCTSPPPQPKNCALSLTRHVPFPRVGPVPPRPPGPPGRSVCACGLALFTLLSGLVGVSV